MINMGKEGVTSIPPSEFTEVPLDGKIKKKLPRRRVYFSDGYLDEYSTDDEQQEQTDSRPLVDPSTLSWLPYVWHMTGWFGSKALAVCDYLGERLAYMLGITTPKFQYEIEQYKKMIEEEEAQKKKLEAENAGWSEKGLSEKILLRPMMKEPLPAKVDVANPDHKLDSAEESVISEKNSQKWERY